jgi:hypothetical protein
LHYEKAVLHAVNHCVITQLLLFDRPPPDSNDGQHDTLISGISGFVNATEHAEVLKPVVGVIGKWVAIVAYGWINAVDKLTQIETWESDELYKYLKLATASCTYGETALKFGSQFKMMKVLYELWDPNPEIDANGTGWFGLKHLGHHKEVHDKRLTGKPMIRNIGR